jgi:glycosyltransferase involved in cell wall biosynthesis
LVLMQFTHLMWSRHGFPYMAIPIALMVKGSGATLSIVMHDPVPYRGSRMRDRLRRSIQKFVMRSLTDLAYAVVTPIATSKLPWSRPSAQYKIHSIPIGSNVGHSLAQPEPARHHTFTIAVFGVTEPVAREAEQLSAIVLKVAAEVGPVHLVLLGRGSREAQPFLEQVLSDRRVTISIVGIAPAGEIASKLGEADVALFIRGEVSTRRGTAIAAIAHGLPLVAYEGVETGWPLTEAGVVLVPEGDTRAIARALVRLANDRDLAARLRARSRAAFGEHFAWGQIAKQFDDIFSADCTLPEARR